MDGARAECGRTGTVQFLSGEAAPFHHEGKVHTISDAHVAGEARYRVGVHLLGNRRGQRIQWYGDGRIAQCLQDWIGGDRLDGANDRVSAAQIDVELLEPAAGQDSAHP